MTMSSFYHQSSPLTSQLYVKHSFRFVMTRVMNGGKRSFATRQMIVIKKSSNKLNDKLGDGVQRREDRVGAREREHAHQQ